MSVDDRLSLMLKLKDRAYNCCPKCSSPRKCSMELGKSSSTCWCMEVSYVDTDKFSEYEVCLCKQCLLEEEKT